MTQKVLKVGSSAAVTIPKKSLDELGLKPGDSVTVKVDKGEVRIVPVAKLSREDIKVAKIAINLIKRYKKDLIELADK